MTVLCGFRRIQCTIEDAKGEDQEEYAAKAASREPGNGGSPVVRGQRNGPGSCDLKGRRITDKRDVGYIGSRVGVNGTPTVYFGAGIQPRERGVLEGMKWAASAAKKGGTARFISSLLGTSFFFNLGGLTDGKLSESGNMPQQYELSRAWPSIRSLAVVLAGPTVRAT